MVLFICFVLYCICFVWLKVVNKKLPLKKRLGVSRPCTSRKLFEISLSFWPKLPWKNIYHWVCQAGVLKCRQHCSKILSLCCIAHKVSTEFQIFKPSFAKFCHGKPPLVAKNPLPLREYVSKSDVCSRPMQCICKVPAWLCSPIYLHLSFNQNQTTCHYPDDYSLKS